MHAHHMGIPTICGGLAGREAEGLEGVPCLRVNAKEGYGEGPNLHVVEVFPL